MKKDIEFNFKANYPLPENEEEFNERAANAIAREPVKAPFVS